MPRKGHTQKRDVLADPIYNNKVVTKLINNIMLDGKGLELKAGKNMRIKICLYWKINCRCLNQMIENMQCLHV